MQVVWNISLPTQYGETVLITACKMKNLELVQRLLKQKADPNIANNVGYFERLPDAVHTEEGILLLFSG